MAKTAIVFPGQGAQAIGMGRDVCEAHSAARDIFGRAHEVVGFDLAAICFDGPAEKLEQTDIQQPAIFATSVAMLEAYRASGAPTGGIAMAGGLSLGEYTALYSAGAFSFEDGLRLVHRRGQLMQEAAGAAPSGMVTLVGASETDAREICEKAAGDDVLAPANYNCPGQIVLAGSKAACSRALTAANEKGVRAVVLAVAGAFHSPYMRSAAEGLELVLTETRIAAPKFPVISNVTADYHGDPATIRKSLAAQVTSPVLWQKCAEKLVADGAERMIEFGPGRVLTGLMKKISRRFPIQNVSTAETIEAAGAAAAGPA